MQDYVQKQWNDASLAAAVDASTALTLATLVSDRKSFLADNNLNVDVVLVVGGIKLVYLRAGAVLLVDLLGVGSAQTLRVYCASTPASGDLLINLLM